MSFAFTKMHGLGNDFVIIDFRAEVQGGNSSAPSSLTPRQIAALCDRRTGIGCDQLVTLAAPNSPGADVQVRFFNPDGSEAGACGNASRCVAALLGDSPTLQTQHGLLPTTCLPGGEIRVQMGRPLTAWQDVPLSEPCDTRALPLNAPRATDHVKEGEKLDGAACSMGNPHATLFHVIEDAALLGPMLEKAPLFPERANIGFAEILSPRHMRLRVWERGAGLTPACGSGACAAVVNAVRRGLVERHCRVEMELGSLEIAWNEGTDGQSGTVEMTGPAVKVFSGLFELTDSTPWSGQREPGL
ncbi:diaminopimelate epimerase [Oecophyllibacter saccharovorans]|uniref:Diaminopimelate epimerase n=1 Tax=Oecophyllibacter saccharovorans TaxID=2558360 RepID=A0A506ULE6_9PROT|nr:diaminopimelate epimerase [Oecophyllibacter saccharovorans]TPW34159.1 diaminopimelate epimerase [Oecophyllibacter saccharovorans]